MNLKNLDYKQVAIDHGEKMVLGLIGLLVLGILAGTSWTSYDKDPEELVAKVSTGEEQLRASVWPDDEREKFESQPDVRERVQGELLRGVQVAHYEFRNPTYWPLIPRREKISEPVRMAVEDMQAKYSTVVLAKSIVPYDYDP
jgi:hypothetical protein